MITFTGWPMIQLIRLPGSRYRRVPVSEVQRLTAQNFKDKSSLTILTPAEYLG
jgi:hypothetical protein